MGSVVSAAESRSAMSSRDRRQADSPGGDHQCNRDDGDTVFYSVIPDNACGRFRVVALRISDHSCKLSPTPAAIHTTWSSKRSSLHYNTD